ncbi:MAG: SDR family oxidoreductase [Anaerolineales bacterium]
MMAYPANFYSNKLALISGGSSGIGLALARQLAQSGANVWLLARRRDQLEMALNSLSTSPSQRHGILMGDVSDWNTVVRLVEDLKQEIGTPDLIINSAGITQPGYVQELPIEIFERMISVNYLGTVYITKALLPSLIERGSGVIVNISSVAGFIGTFGYSAYGASKFAVRGFSDVLRAELKPHGIQVAVVFPPDTDTPQLAYEEPFKPPETRALSKSGGLLTAEQVALAILNGVSRGKYIILPGLETKILYHLNHLLGNAIYPLMDMLIANARSQINKNNSKI